jgi:glycerophosphoryl diester phosphodiesterase
MAARTTWSRLGKVRLKNGEPLPSRSDALDLIRGRVPINIESKTAGGIAAAAKAIANTGFARDLVFSSGLREECLAARSLFPLLPCGLVTRRPSASDLAFCRNNGLSSIHPDYRQLTALRLCRLREYGIPFVPWTIDVPRDAFRLFSVGAVGVFSNRAQYLRDTFFGQNEKSALINKFSQDV